MGVITKEAVVEGPRQHFRHLRGSLMNTGLHLCTTVRCIKSDGGDASDDPNSQSFSFASVPCHWPAAITNSMNSIRIGLLRFLRTILAQVRLVNAGAGAERALSF